MRNKATKKNMDLDLRRYGKMLYSKAEESGGSDGGEGGDSGEVDYEAIYQFYRKAVLETVPEEYQQSVVIPEHLADVEWGGGKNHANGTGGIWKGEEMPPDGTVLFCCLKENHISIDICIYFGQYIYVGGGAA